MKMRFAYADPPYPGQAERHYSDDPQWAEVDHIALIAGLESARYDGWALSTNEPSLEYVTDCLKANGLRRSAGDYRTMAWVKPFASFKPNVNPAFCWEPVIVRGGRKRTRKQDTVRDWIAANITLRKGLSGVKPQTFCYWLFEVLNMESGDEFIDLYPGSGAVSKAWNQFIGRPTQDDLSICPQCSALWLQSDDINVWCGHCDYIRGAIQAQAL